VFICAARFWAGVPFEAVRAAQHSGTNGQSREVWIDAQTVTRLRIAPSVVFRNSRE
jgi:hypothetical protein